MKRSVLIASLLAAVIAAPLTATAAESVDAVSAREARGYGKDKHMMKQERRFERMAEVLELSAEQQAQIRAIRAAEREKTEPLRQQLREGRDKIRETAAKQPFDEAAVRDLAQKQAELRTEMIVSHARMRNQIDALLSPEQREKAKELRSFGQERRGCKGPCR